MQETDQQIAELQQLLDKSFGGSTQHLLSIMEPHRRMSAERIAAEMPPAAVLNVSTVTAKGEPRISAVDGHFIGGRWYFTTAVGAAKAKHLAARPAISAAYTPKDGYGVFCHGRAVRVSGTDRENVMRTLTEHYGSDPDTWGDIVCFRIDPQWMVGFAMTEEEFAQIEAARAERESGAE